MAANLRQNTFTWRGLTFQQHPDVFKIGTDALLLTRWIIDQDLYPSRILDAGTGTGILALVLAHHFPNAFVNAIDVNEHSVSLAKLNRDQNHLTGRCVIRQQSVLDLNSNEQQFDLVVVNPPYFMSGPVSPSGSRSAARHTLLTPIQWIKSCESVLVPEGRMAMVLPAPDAGTWIRQANALGLYVERRMNVFSKLDDQQPVRVLLSLTRILTSLKLDTLVLRNRDNQMNPDLVKWLGLENSSQMPA